MGRLEAYAMSNKPCISFLDALGNEFGYGWILVAVGFFRELLGSATLFGIQIIPQALYTAAYVNNGLMVMPPMALILVAGIIWIQRAKNIELQEKN